MNKPAHYRSHWLVLLACSLAAVCLVALGTGSVKLPVSESFQILLARLPFTALWMGPPTWPDTHETILMMVRLPRIVLGVLTGTALALAGAVFQGLFRNPMADPFVIGVSSGAALGAVIAMVTRASTRLFDLGAVPVFAFAGSLAAVAVVYRISRINGRVPVATLLLSGIAVSSFCSALVSLLIYFNEEEIGPVVFWLMGGLGTTDWSKVQAALPYVIAGLVILVIHTRELNVMLLGEEQAQQLGVPAEAVKIRLLVGASILTAAAVSVTGVIGFVGLITPHAIRLLFGPDHRLLLPASALAGALLMVSADTTARMVIAPSELPVGIVTSLLGAPFFLYLLRQKQREIF